MTMTLTLPLITDALLLVVLGRLVFTRLDINLRGLRITTK